METQHWIKTVFNCEYIDQRPSVQLAQKCLEIGRRLSGMMDKAELFYGGTPRTLLEDTAVYVTDSEGEETDHYRLITAIRSNYGN